MKLENSIEVRNVSKKFKVYQDKGKTLKEMVLFSNRRKYEERLVLKNISFEVKQGEAIGLIGQNGCGKSTTLKLLTKIMYPDSGIIQMKGRVSSLIELGAGFHPDMSGRQNIYTNASIFGLTRKEIEEKLNSIIAFSELEEFIDNPVRTYSSGMYMRLAFSVAINVGADILLIDEILAVGDSNFQAKCFNKLREIKAKGSTIIIVSHSLSQIEQLCERSIWLNDGHIKLEGLPRDVHPQYLDYMGQHSIRFDINNKNRAIIDSDDGEGIEVWEDGRRVRWGSGQAQIIDVKSYNKKGQVTTVFCTGESVEIAVKYKVFETVNNAVLGVGIFRSDGLQCYGTNTMLERFLEFSLNTDGKYTLEFHNMDLLPGEYYINLTLEKELGIPIDYYTRAIYIRIYSDIEDVGVCRLAHTWGGDIIST